MEASGTDSWRASISTLTTIRMYDFGSLSEISVQDFKSYPAEFPFRDQSCLMRPSPTLTRDMLTMHTEDSADDAIIAEQLGHHAVTRSQAQSMGRAVQTPFIAPIADSTPQPPLPPPAIVFVPAPAYQWERHRIPNAHVRLCVRPLNSS